MKVSLEQGEWRGSVVLPLSKSALHRALILSALSEGTTRIRGFSGAFGADESDDLRATRTCLEALGASVTRDEYGYTVTPISRPVSGARLNCLESGSTLRFLLPVIAALGCGALFEGSGRLPKRPIGALLSCLRAGGVSALPSTLPLCLSGKLLSGRYTVDGSVSSQFVSGMLIALSLLDGESVLTVTGDGASGGYIGLTCSLLERFGAKIRRNGRDYVVSGGGLRSPGELTVEGDVSTAAAFLCAGALGGTVRVIGADASSLQPDTALLSILTEMGAEVTSKKGEITVRAKNLRGVDRDLRDCPDLLPVLAVTASAAEGKSSFSGISGLRAKESDRLETTAELLSEIGGCAVVTDDVFTVLPQKPTGGSVPAKKDHRLVMAAALASCFCPVEIEGAEAVRKSCPEFFRMLREVGVFVKTEKEDRVNETGSKRNELDEIDRQIVCLLARRYAICGEIGHIKNENGSSVRDPLREEELLSRVGGEAGIYSDEVQKVYRAVLSESRLLQNIGMSGYGLLGERLSHSLSPGIHKALGGYPYRLFEVSPDDLGRFMKDGKFDGLNVTVPYKKAVIGYLDRLDESASRVGAVNVVLRQNGELVGYNTDDYGFIRALRSSGIGVCGKRCTVLGTGGGAQAVRAALEELGASKISFVSRSGEPNYHRLESVSDTQVLINATPVGMFPHVGECPLDPDVFPRLEAAFDLIYNPDETELLRRCRTRGVRCANGLWMLLWQAKASCELFCGKEVPEETVGELYRRMTGE